MLSFLGMKGLSLRRASESRTSTSTSEKACADQPGRWPVSSSSLAANSSSLKVSMPQSVWWSRMISSVPSRFWEIARERIASSVTTPPALRSTWASPSFSPRTRVGIRRASMQARTATCFDGGIPRSDLSKESAYARAFSTRRSVSLIRLAPSSRQLALSFDTARHPSLARSSGRHSKSSVEAYGLPVQHPVLHDVAGEGGVFVRQPEAAGERDLTPQLGARVLRQRGEQRGGGQPPGDGHNPHSPAGHGPRGGGGGAPPSAPLRPQ